MRRYINNDQAELKVLVYTASSSILLTVWVNCTLRDSQERLPVSLVKCLSSVPFHLSQQQHVALSCWLTPVTSCNVYVHSLFHLQTLLYMPARVILQNRKPFIWSHGQDILKILTACKDKHYET